MRIGKHSVVSIDYTLTGADGEVLDSSKGREPLTYIQGTGSIVIGLIQVTIVLVAGELIFNVPVRGSLVDLYLAALLFIAASLGLGLLISTVARTQFQAMQLTVFTFLPSILLSGFMFPFDGMPRFAQELGELLPLTHFIRLVRGIQLRAADLNGLLPDVWPLAVFFFLTMTLAILKFRKRLD